jgi:hypothetical protein
MKQLEEQKKAESPQNGISENQQGCMSDLDAKTLESLRDLQPICKDSIDKLGIVLDDMVNMQDLDGSGIDVYLLHYVVNARQCLRAILQILDEPNPVKSSSKGQEMQF